MHIAWGTAAIGALIGLYVSWSRSAIAPEIVTGLMAVILGAGGIQLLKMDVTQPAVKARMQVAGSGLFALSVAAIVSTVFAVALAPFIATLSSPSLPSIANSSSPYEDSLTRARWVALGVTPSEMKQIINKNNGQWPTMKNDLGREISEFLQSSPKPQFDPTKAIAHGRRFDLDDGTIF